MRQTQLFTKTRKEAPKDEVARNAQLLVRGGFIHKEMAGVYTYLPLGVRVLKKISNIIREEMNTIGGVEIDMTALQDPNLWKKTGRWNSSDVDVWFKTKLNDGSELGLSFTHEEPLTQLMKNHIFSYQDLPVYPYQIQLKFRNELRAKSGIMRTREFLMKDLYSFSRNEKEHKDFYERVAAAYMKIFARVGLNELTYRTFASGGSFSKYSDEFQTITDAGEDTIYISKEKKIAVNKEVYTDKTLADLGLSKSELEEVKAVEVGNIFSLGTRFSEELSLTYKDENGKAQFPIMGSYGIGPGRLMGTVVEVLSDEKGIIWPEEIAPFHIHLLVIGEGKEVRERAEVLYKNLSKQRDEVLYDDREISAGEKFADSDLLGIPSRAVISAKTLAEGKIELVDRRSGERRLVDEGELPTRL